MKPSGVWALAALLALLQDGWWDASWGYRRTLTIRNRLGSALPSGHPVHVRFSPGFLGFDRKCREDLADLRLVRAGKIVPHDVSRAESEGDERTLSFRLAADIGPKSFDRYVLYYGNASAAPGERAQVMELSVGFDSEADLKRFAFDGGLTASIQEGKAVFSGDRGAAKVRELSGLATFRLRTRLSFRAEDPRGSAVALVRLRARPPVAADPGVAKRVAELLEKLGDEEYRTREDATAALVEIGKDAVALVDKAYKETRDPEVRWRCEFVLQEIAKRSPTPEIVVQYSFLPGGALQIRTTIGGKVAESSARAGGTVELEIIRMEKHGSVRIVTPGTTVANLGALSEEIDEVSIQVAKMQGGALALHGLSVERYLSDQGRPSFEIDVEEGRR
jgi:hypothetical protein